MGQMKRIARRQVLFLSPAVLLLMCSVSSAFSFSVVGNPSGEWCNKVIAHLQTLVSSGRDHYGPVQSPLFLAVLSDETLTPDDDAPIVKLPPDERAVGGVNLWTQVELLHLLNRMTDFDSSFAQAADSNLTWYADHLAVFAQHGQDGMLWWGSHLHYNALDDLPASISKLENQITLGAGVQDPRFLWERLWALRPETAEHQTELIWLWFIHDKKDGSWDRHAKNTENWAVGFSQAGASYLYAFSEAFQQTGALLWKQRAEIIRDHMWAQRNGSTGLIPSAANTDDYGDRGADFWRLHFCSSVEPSTWVPALLYCHQTFGDVEWLNQAEVVIKGYLEHAYDSEADAFYKWVRLDGVYDTNYSTANNPSEEEPGEVVETVEAGYSSFWRDSIGFRNNGRIALACLDFYDIQPDPVVLNGARLIGDQLLEQDPKSDTSSGGRATGAWAENYANALEILRRLHRVTGEQDYLDRAVFMAEDGIGFLWNPQTKIFRAHSLCGYETSGGTDRWCEQLVDLEFYLEELSGD